MVGRAMDLLKRILRAQVYAVAKQTPVERAPHLSRVIGNELFLKREYAARLLVQIARRF